MKQKTVYPREGQQSPELSGKKNVMRLRTAPDEPREKSKRRKETTMGPEESS